MFLVTLATFKVPLGLMNILFTHQFPLMDQTKTVFNQHIKSFQPQGMLLQDDTAPLFSFHTSFHSEYFHHVTATVETAPEKFSARHFASRARQKVIFTGHVCHIFLLLSGTLIASITSLFPLLFFCCLLSLQHNNCALSLLVSAFYVAACASDLSALQGVAG